jgi:hypothetical protein
MEEYLNERQFFVDFQRDDQAGTNSYGAESDRAQAGIRSDMHRSFLSWAPQSLWTQINQSRLRAPTLSAPSGASI